MNFLGHPTNLSDYDMNNNYLADIHRVYEIKDLIWVMRFQSPQVYDTQQLHIVSDSESKHQAAGVHTAYHCLKNSSCIYTCYNMN